MPPPAPRLTARLLAGAVAAVALLVADVSGHGGSLHDWDFTDPERDVNRHLLATCSPSNWAPIARSTLRPLPVFADDATTATLSFSNNVNLWLYQAGNCSDKPNTAFEAAHFTITDLATGAPYANRPTYAYGYTGNCSAPGDFYRFNYTRGDSRFNILWWGNQITDENGTLWGTAPNDGDVTLRPTPSAQPIQSIVLLTSPADSPAMCCTLTYNEPPPPLFYASGEVCNALPPSPSPPSPAPKTRRRPPPKKNRRRPPPKKTKRRPPPHRMGN